MSGEIQTIKLRDGRRLAYAEYGDPAGKPVMYFHGWPVSHLGAQKYGPLAKKLGIRIIAPDRPGFGLSDYQKDRTLLDWPDDVVALADFLKIKKFVAMGVSGGGPYAAACGYKIPDRITKLGIVVGLGPLVNKHSLDGMMWMSKVGWANYGKHASVRRFAALLQFLNARYGFGLGLHRFLFGAKADRKVYQDASIRKNMRDNFREAFWQGYLGPELDLKLYTTDWGFHVRDIKAKTFLWYGQEDRNVSINMANYYAKRIRGSKLTVYPGEGHFLSLLHMGEILRTLAS